MQINNWSSFTKRITIHATAEQIYFAWASQQGLEKWFLRNAYFTAIDGTRKEQNELIQQQDEYLWNWYGYADDVKETNRILFANGIDEIHFGFANSCIVTVHIIKEENEMICELNQQMPMNNEEERKMLFIECGLGWTFYLTNLKSVLEGGADLRNKNEKIKRVLNS
jgi:uncharacterized protein YndB with AHSA1/START domain